MKIQWNKDHPDQALLVYRRKELNSLPQELLSRAELMDLNHPIRFCKILYNQGELMGTFAIPQKAHPIQDRMSFAFLFYENSLVFISDHPEFQHFLNSFMNESDLTISSAFQFLLRFMNYMIQEDVYFLEDYNEKMESLEENIFQGRQTGVEQFIMIARRDMNILSNYYLQLFAAGETMQEVIIPQNQPDESAMLSLFLSRSSQLQNLVGTIKDNTAQIWNLRQTQLSDKQNKISTLLTVISTVFLPLTFLTGWYGMNFTTMPLVKMQYGYLIFFCLVALIVVCEIAYIKRHRWLSLSVSPDMQKGSTRHQKKIEKMVSRDHHNQKEQKKEEREDIRHEAL